uniref:Alpha-galactosidase n=1 Tax=Spodoptera frugiperda TaxID=7108 RepID=A0A2H1VWQ0_SPOFR
MPSPPIPTPTQRLPCNNTNNTGLTKVHTYIHIVTPFNPRRGRQRCTLWYVMPLFTPTFHNLFGEPIAIYRAHFQTPDYYYKTEKSPLRRAFCLLFLIFSLDKVDLLENGLARTPPMGWMSWGYYMCGVKCEDAEDKCLNEQLILSVADSFYKDGYQEAGFEYIIIDDCWSEKQRDKNGRLVADRKRFPRGMKYIADYIHARGLKFGMYTNVANITCMRYPGSLSHMELDAKTFAEWGVDYLKVDGCFVSEAILNGAYIQLGKYLKQTGRPMVYSCSWPYYIEFIHQKNPDYEEVARYCNMWRNYHDVQTSWDAIANIVRHYRNHYHELAPFHGPGHWNDPDMLSVPVDAGLCPHQTHTTASTDPHRTNRIIDNAYMRCVLMTSYGMCTMRVCGRLP